METKTNETNPDVTTTEAQSNHIFKQDADAAAAAQKAAAVPPVATENEPAATPDDQKEGEPAKKADEQKTETDGDKKPDDKGAEADPEKPKAPESYDLKKPEDSVLSDQAIERISQYAKEKGLTNDEAQALVDRDHSTLKEHIDAENAAYKARQEGWTKAVQSDKELGGDKWEQSVAESNKVIEKFGSDQLKTELEKTGLGNYPELVRVFARIGRAMAPDTFIKGGQPPKPKISKEQKFYPKMFENQAE